MVDMKPQSFRVIEGDGGSSKADPAVPEHVGAFLREARESTGRNLSDIAIALRIRAKFLQSIEDGRYEDLPGSTYAVGFIRSYADYLGLDTDSLLARFKAESRAAEAGPDLDFPAPSTVGWFPTGKVVATCAILAVAVFGGWFFLQTGDSVDVAAVPEPPGFNAAAASAVTGNQPVAPAASGALDVGGQPPLPTDEADISAELAAVGMPEDATVGETAATSAAVQTAGDAAQPADSEQPSAALAPVTASATPQSTADGEEALQSAPAPAADVEVETSAAETPDAPAPSAAATPAAETPRPVAKPSAASDNKPAPAAASAPQPEPAAAPAVPERAVQAPDTPAASADDSAAADTGSGGQVFGDTGAQARVVIGAKDDSWVQVLDEEQNVVLTRMLRAGDRYMVPNRSDLVMLTGNAGGLIISVDGEPVPQIGSDGAILHNVRLDADALKAGRAVMQ